jgi:hypothetical protein
MGEASMITVLSSSQRTSAPRKDTISRRVSTSPILGMFSSVTGSDAMTVAAIAGRAAFLLPAGLMLPLSE